MDKRLQNKNERAINKRNVDLIIAREEAKIKKRQMKERTGNPKIDGPLEDFEKVYGYKIGSKFDEKINAMKDGGLAMAIEKVKAKEMKLGGEAKPLVGGQKKLDKNKDGRISGDDFAMMKDGGVAKRTKKEKIYGELPKGSKGRGMQNTFNNVKQLEAMARGDTLELGSLEKMPEGRRRVLQTIKKIQRDPSGTKNVYRGQGDVITSSQEEERAEKAKTKPKKMKMGGKVEEYGGGGSVKGGKMSCRGMGAAIKGGGFSIR